MDKLRMGVIGLGNMGSEHCRLILSGRAVEIELCCVADLRQERRDWARATLPESVAVFTSGQELIDQADCDAVIIAVPHYDHPALTVAALRRGLHVLCEKPVAVYTAQVQPMLEAARESGRTFALMFNQRTNCVYRRMKEIVDSGELGPMKRMAWTITDWYRSQAYYDSGSWRATWAGEGGGVLLNQCPHQLDLLQWICGLPVKVRAFAHEGKWHDIEVEDDVTAYLEFAGGATGVFIASTGDLPGTNRLEITFDKGKLICENGKLLMWKLPMSESEGYRSSADAYPTPRIEPIVVETDGENPQHIGVTNAFAAHILHGTPLVAEGAEGLNALMLSNAMHLSSWLERPVELPIDEELFARLLRARRLTSRRKDTKDVTFSTDHSATGKAL
ncbi:MAG: Gfo/Idh/MocA family oxidoreductase [Clostridiales bacterium]|nr:Gfo/Idh/MocA family oxidoreductase [Clostridiales bacterium]